MTVLHAYPNKDPPERALYGCGAPKIVFFGYPLPKTKPSCPGGLVKFFD